MSKKINVWIVTRGIPDENYPLFAIFEYTQALHLIHNYSDQINLLFLGVDLRSVRRRRKYRFDKTKDGMTFIGRGLPVGNLPHKIFDFCAGKHMRSALQYCKKKYGEPDIIHTHFAETGYAVAQNKDLFERTKFVHTEHWSQVNQTELKQHVKKIAEYTYRHADQVISVSPALQDSIRNHFGIASVYIPNMIDEELFHYRGPEITAEPIEDSRININDGDFLYLCVANLIPEKNLDGLIKAFSKAFINEENTKLFIIGGGPEEHKLLALIQEAKKENQIRLLGQRQHEEIADWMKQADCFVLASKSETFGVVYAEAIMCGTPVIATKCGGPECIVNDKNGVLIDINNEQQLIEALKDMRHQAPGYSKENISQAAAEQFGTRAVSAQILQLYRDLLKDTAY